MALAAASWLASEVTSGPDTMEDCARVDIYSTFVVKEAGKKEIQLYRKTLPKHNVETDTRRQHLSAVQRFRLVWLRIGA